jgi:hypothetical protein
MPTLHHTHSASSIPNSAHYNNPHFNVSMNGHVHHVGGGHGLYNLGGTFNPYGVHNPNPYQSSNYIPTHQTPFYNQSHQQQNPQYQQYGMNHFNQNQNQPIMNGNNLYQQQTPINQFNTTNTNNNNNFAYNQMSNQGQQNQQQHLNPQHQTLGGYHNQGFGSHQQQGQEAQNAQKQ